MQTDEHPALTAAYREYAERMYKASDDLVIFDRFTIPAEIDIDSPCVREFGDVG